MATLTIRNLDEGVKRELRLRAARHSRSMEAEAREILSRSLEQEPPAEENFGLAIHSYFQALDVEEIPLPPRHAIRNSPDLGD